MNVVLAVSLFAYTGHFTDGVKSVTSKGVAFVIDDHIVVTCYHNVKDKTTHKLTIGKKDIECIVLGVDEKNDIALLGVPGDRLTVVRLDDTRTEVFYVDAPVRRGDSGAPVYDHGKIIGMIRGSKAGKAAVVPTSLILRLKEKIR